MWGLAWAPHTGQGLLVWARLLSDLLSSFHTPPHPTLTHSPSAPDTGKSTCCLPWEVPAPGHGLPRCLHYLFPQCFLSHFLVLAVIPC